MATYKNDIILIAGSGDFAFETANFLSDKSRLNLIILLSKNYKITKSFKNNVSNFDVRDLEKSSISVDPNNNFKPTYVVSSDKRDVVRKLKSAVKRQTAALMILATG